MGRERMDATELIAATSVPLHVALPHTFEASLIRDAIVVAIVALALRLVLRLPRLRHGAYRSRAARRAWYREEYLRSAHWRARRERALQLAGYRCERCGAPAPLDVHHLTYARIGRERDRDLRVLCRACHEDEHHPLLALVRGLLRAVRRAFVFR